MSNTAEPIDQYWFSRHSKSIIFLVCILAAIGIYEALTLPVAVFPTTDFPRIIIGVDNGVMPIEQMEVSVTRPLEGAMRPGHFKGVTTVVAKLFNGVQPHKAYFGQKDAQQVAVIRQMVRDLNFPTEIVVCPIIREADGLAMSSRNVYLDPEQRKAATVLFRSLSAAKEAYEQGERDAEKVRGKMKEILASEPLAQVQYVSCADYDTLEELDVIKGKALLSMAVFMGKTRLIDNFVLG